MLVQDRTVSNSPKSQIRQQLHTINHHRFSESKSLDFSTWVSENLYKIIVVLLLVTTIAALFVLRSSSDAASLLQSQSQQHSPSSISLTVIKWNSITPITDSAKQIFDADGVCAKKIEIPSQSIESCRPNQRGGDGHGGRKTGTSRDDHGSSEEGTATAREREKGTTVVFNSEISAFVFANQITYNV
ncbi:hypothetical protein ACOSQ4_013189 [Xanthoceras sorbifolium]